MSKTTKTIIIIAAILIVVGMALCVTAFASADWNINKLYSLVNAHGEPEYTKQQYDIPVEGLSQLSVENVADNVTLLLNTEDTIRVVCYDTQYYTYRVEANGDTLDIRYYKPDSVLGWINLIPNLGSANLEIWLPESFFTEANIDLETVSGEIRLDNIRGKDLNAETVSGSIQISGGTFNQITWQTISGDVALTDIAGTVPKGETTSGSINILNCAFTEMYLYTMSGDIQATLLGNSQDYRIKAQSVSGDIEKDRGNDQADQQIYMETVSGDIDLQFIEQ
jgi:hypothetical protein